MTSLLRPSSLVLVLVTIFQFLIPAVLSIPQPLQRTTGLQYGADNDGNGYWWQEIEDASVKTVSDASIKAEVKADYEAMVKAAKAKDVPTTEIPSLNNAILAGWYTRARHFSTGIGTLRRPISPGRHIWCLLQHELQRMVGVGPKGARTLTY